MFPLFHFLHRLIQFIRATRVFLAEAESQLDQHDPDDAFALRRDCRRILFFAALFPVVGGLIAPVVTAWIVCSWANIRDIISIVSELVWGLFGSLAMSFFYLFAGVAFGCLLATDEFLTSPVGELWLKLIGTKNLTAARLVCLATVLAGIAILAAMTLLQARPLWAPGWNR
jgi:hypothetical protein